MAVFEQIPKVQYTKSGDYYLAYQVIGDGPQTILFVGGFVSHLELMWEQPDSAAFFKRLSQCARVILFDKRGVGLSDRVGSVPTPEETMEDISVILDAVGCETATLMSVSEGGPVVVLFAATYPNRTEQLILYGTMPKWIRSYDYPWALSRSQYDRWLASMIDNWGGPVALRHFAPSRCEDEDFLAWWAKVLRHAATPGSVKGVMEALRDIDVREVLAHVHVPTLVLHRKGDTAVPVAGGRFLAENLPNSRFVELSGQDHWWWVGDSDAILDEIDCFMAKSGADIEVTPLVKAHETPQTMVESLTDREMDVLRLIAAGYTNQQVADELVLTLGTVKTYTSHIYAKLNVENRTQAVFAARKMGLIR